MEKVIEVQAWPWPSKFQPLGGVAVIARNTGAAIKGRDALKVVWDDGPNARYDFARPIAPNLKRPSRKPGKVVRNDGDIEAGLKASDKVIVGEYYLPHLAHASMEPPVATAQCRRTARPRSGRPCKAPAAPATTSRRHSGFPSKMSPST